MQLHEIQDLERRVKSYWYDDGIAELSGGGMFLLLGIYFALQGYLGPSSFVSVILQVSMVLVLILGAFLVRRAINTLKSRLTYPRTGFVEYRVNEKDVKRRRYWAAAIALVVSSASMALYRFIRVLDAVVLVTGLLLGLILIVLRARSDGMQRLYVLGGFSILLGMGLSVAGLPQAYGLALFYGLLGGASMVSGGSALRRYLAENPMPPEAPRDR